MIKENEAEFKKANIDVWQKDNLGENTHIVVLDDEFEIYDYIMPNATIMTFGEVDETPETGHGASITATGYTIAPKAKITYIPYMDLRKEQQEEALQWIVDNEEDIDVVTMSLVYNVRSGTRELWDTIKDIKVPFFVATGNDGDDKIRFPSSLPCTISVGAFSDYGDAIWGKSNHGEGLDILGYHHIYYLSSSGRPVAQIGTSIATPFVAYSTLLYISWRKRNRLPKLTREEWKEWQKIYAKDIEDKGYDLRSGLGIFRLPSEIPILKKEEENVKEDISDKEIINIEEGEEIKPILKLGNKGDDVKLLQTELNGLGLSVGAVDGIFGKNTDAAIKELQYIFSLVADGIVGNQTYSLLDKLDKIKNFKLSEFRCRHCGKLKLNINLLLKLEELRTALGDKPMVINSGYRCITHNTNVGGIRTSEHLKGNAADIRVVGLSPEEVHKVADTMFSGGVGKYNTFTHVDVGINRYRWDNSTKKKESLVKTIKRFSSNIFYIETTSNQFVDVDLGVRFKKETVREMVKNKKAIAGINGGFFGVSKASEHIGLYIDEGLYYNPPNSDFVEFIYYKSGLTEIVNMAGYDKTVLSNLQSTAHWAIGTSYSLIQRGKINLLNADKFSHSKNKEPRTMFGQKFDGTFILVVADGRSTSSKGLTAKEQAEVMLELGCYNAVNLDGGGSSTMVYNNQVVNKPSDGVERKVGSVMLVYQKGEI